VHIIAALFVAGLIIVDVATNTKRRERLKVPKEEKNKMVTIACRSPEQWITNGQTTISTTNFYNQ